MVDTNDNILTFIMVKIVDKKNKKLYFLMKFGEYSEIWLEISSSFLRRLFFTFPYMIPQKPI